METGDILKAIIKEHGQDDEQPRKKKILQNFLNIWERQGVKIIHYENNWKKRRFKEAARIIFYKKDEVIDKKEDCKTILTFLELNTKQS